MRLTDVTEEAGIRFRHFSGSRSSQLPEDIDIRKGAQLVMQQDGKHYPVWVEKVQGPTVVLTPQHPLAGVTLHFQVKVIEVREASEEEVQHGHVHGPGGHEH